MRRASTIGGARYINRHTMIDASELVEIGDEAMIGPFCYITDHDHAIRAGTRAGDDPLVSAPTRIGARCWLGAHVTVLKGVTIGEGTVGRRGQRGHEIAAAGSRRGRKSGAGLAKPVRTHEPARSPSASPRTIGATNSRARSRALARLDPPPDEIIVAADGCTDGTAEWLRATHPACGCIEHDRRAARSPRATKWPRPARCEIFVSLDDDSYPLDGDFIARVRALFADASAARGRLLSTAHG